MATQDVIFLFDFIVKNQNPRKGTETIEIKFISLNPCVIQLKIKIPGRGRKLAGKNAN